MRAYLTLLLVGLVVLPGCFSGKKPAASAEKTLIYGRGEDANTLDPIHTDIGESVKVMVNIYDTLVTYDDETVELVPSLATEWKHGDDGLTWQFKLRSDVTFHDGTKFDADAVVFSFQRMLQKDHPHVHYPQRPYQTAYEMIDSVTAVDPATVEFKLKTPSAVFLQNLAMFCGSIVSPAAVKKHGASYGEHPVGTGPFQFASWKRKQLISLTAYADHWRGAPGVEQVIFLSVGENITRAQKLARGECQIADDLDPAELDRLAQDKSMVVQEVVGLNVAYLSIQMEKGALQHRDVRHAIGHAIDKREIIRLAYGGKAEPAVNMCPKDMWGHNNDIQDRAYDIAQAKALLENCAQREGFSLPLELSLAVMNEPRPYLPQPDVVGSYIKDSLAKIGIKLSIKPRNVNEHFEFVMSGGHELALAGWYTDNNDIDNFLYQLLDSDNISQHGNNLSRYNNPELHTLLLAGQREVDQDQRLPLYLKAQEIIFDDAPTVPLVHARFRVAHHKSLQGYKLHPTGIVRLRLAHFEDAP